MSGTLVKPCNSERLLRVYSDYINIYISDDSKCVKLLCTTISVKYIGTYISFKIYYIRTYLNTTMPHIHPQIRRYK